MALSKIPSIKKKEYKEFIPEKKELSLEALSDQELIQMWKEAWSGKQMEFSRLYYLDEKYFSKWISGKRKEYDEARKAVISFLRGEGPLPLSTLLTDPYLEALPDSKLAEIWLKNKILTRRQFARVYNLNLHKFEEWLEGKIQSPEIRKAVISFIVENNLLFEEVSCVNFKDISLLFSLRERAVDFPRNLYIFVDGDNSLNVINKFFLLTPDILNRLYVWCFFNEASSKKFAAFYIKEPEP
jgi:hypothetical protein